MDSLKKYNQELNEATNFLNKGEIIAIPTDTYFGLACDAFNQQSLENLFKLKQRNADKPLPSLISDKKDLLGFGIDFSNFQPILDAFWPGPLTIVIKTDHNFINGMVKDLGYVGFRVPNHNFTIDLINNFGSPLTGTSANLSGEPETKDINVLKDSLDLNYIKKIVNISCGNEESASTVIKILKNKIKLLRDGPVKYEQIINLIGNNYEYE